MHQGSVNVLTGHSGWQICCERTIMGVITKVETIRPLPEWSSLYGCALTYILLCSITRLHIFKRFLQLLGNKTLTQGFFIRLEPIWVYIIHTKIPYTVVNNAVLVHEIVRDLINYQIRISQTVMLLNCGYSLRLTSVQYRSQLNSFINSTSPQYRV